MKVGDYVRTKYGISKIENISPNEYDKEHDYIELENFVFDGLDTQGFFTTDEIIKSSPNILDLIEVGDVLSFKDGSVCRVMEITDDGYYLLRNYGGEQYYESKEWIGELTSIVTKEQFESMEYKVGD